MTRHSLGATTSLLVRKELAKNNCILEIGLFNPPNIAIPISILIKDEKIKKLINATKIMHQIIVTSTKVVMVTFIGPGFDVLQCHVDPFVAICEWEPHFYLNLAEPICFEYKEDFEIRERMKKHGLAMFERLAN